MTVYSLAFLAHMILFIVGDILLKYKRRTIPRPYAVPWVVVIFSMLLGFGALVGVALSDVDGLKVFSVVMVVVLVGVYLVFQRTQLLKILLYFVSKQRLLKYVCTHRTYRNSLFVCSI